LRQHRFLVLPRRTQAEDAAHGGDQQHVAAADEVACRRQPQAVEVVVAAGVFLDVDVALRDVRLGLVIIVVRDEITDGVMREELLEFLVKLGSERLVV